MADEILVELFDDDADPERVDALARSLRRELLELDVDSVEQAVAGPAPEGSRSVELAAIGALLVKATSSTEMVAKVVAVLRGWLRGGAKQHRTVRVTLGSHSIELDNATPDQQQQLVEQFLRSATGDPS